MDSSDQKGGGSFSAAGQNRDSRSHSPYVSQGAWYNRLPSPPRVYIAPPAFEYVKDKNMKAFEEVVATGTGSNAENLTFLERVTYGNHTPNFSTSSSDWTYEERRNAHQITPFLWLAPYSAARSREFISRQGITLLLGIRADGGMKHLMNPVNICAQLGIEFIPIDVRDTQELISEFSTVFNTINNHLLKIYNQGRSINIEKHGRVIVFCESGNERSAAVTIGYLMSMYGLDLNAAAQTVQGQRFCVTLDDTIKGWLKSYEDILLARRQVEDASAGGNRSGVTDLGKENVPNLKHKRSFQEAHSEDVDIEMGGTGNMDSSRFVRRAGWVPFEDPK